MRIHYNEGLNKDVLAKIENTNYSEKELDSIHKQVVDLYRSRKIGFKRVVIIFYGFSIFSTIMAFMNAANKKVTIFSILITGVFFYLFYFL